jgi:hypothetical protein
MKNTNQTGSVYIELQKLKCFVEFVAGLSFSSGEEKAWAKEIVWLIEHLHQPETHREWMVCLDIYDPEVQCRHIPEGIYRRGWMLNFEKGRLSLEAVTNHSKSFDHYGNDFHLGFRVEFREGSVPALPPGTNLDAFVQDAVSYEKYICSTLNSVEVDIKLKDGQG